MKQKKLTIAQWIVYALFSILTLVAGIPKIILADQPVEMLSALNYPLVGVQLIGLVWVLVAIAVWFNHLRSYAALLATHIAAGFIATHIAAAIPANPMMFAYLVIPVAVLYLDGFFKRVSPGLLKDIKNLEKDLEKEEQ